MIERAKARGEVADDVDPAIVADLVSAFAWVHLLTGRLDAGEQEIRAAARLVMQGIAKRAS